MDEAERLCSRLLVLDHGKKIAEGKPRDLIAQYLEPDVVEVYGVGAVALAEGLGMRVVFETARMYAGPAPQIDLARVYGITTFELG